jgi:hypothetical protein
MKQITIPSPAERDELSKTFARALFNNDMDARSKVAAAPDFLWSFHDGLAMTKSLAGPAAIREHPVEQKALYEAQSFHGVVYHHAADMLALQAKIGGPGRTRTCGRTVTRLKPLAGNHATPPPR